MRKVMLFVLSTMVMAIVAMPAYAQGGATPAGGGAGWVPLASGFGITPIAADL